MLAYHLALSAECPGCEAPIPLDALSPVVTCPSCHAATNLEPSDWRRALECLALQAASGYPRVAADVSELDIAGSAAPVVPCCRCGAPLSDAELAAVSPARPWMRHACGAALLVRSFPDFGSIAHVIGESSPSAPTPPGTGFIVTVTGELERRIRFPAQFCSIEQAFADAAGNVFCRGRLVATAEISDGCTSDAEGNDDVYFVDSVWSLDPHLRTRWKVALSCGRLLPVEAGLVAGADGESPLLSRDDGSISGAPPALGQLAGYAQAIRDADGTYVVAMEDSVRRVSPEDGQTEVPLFAAQGFFARLTTDVHLTATWGASIAIASDGDLVVHHANIDEPTMISRFDRQGHRKLAVPSPLGCTFGQQAQLAAGPAGVVWARTKSALGAITPAGVQKVSLPEDAERYELMVAMPDGSLLFFGDDCRVARATMNGLTLAGWNVLSG